MEKFEHSPSQENLINLENEKKKRENQEKRLSSFAEDRISHFFEVLDIQNGPVATKAEMLRAFLEKPAEFLAGEYDWPTQEKDPQKAEKIKLAKNQPVRKLIREKVREKLPVQNGIKNDEEAGKIIKKALENLLKKAEEDKRVNFSTPLLYRSLQEIIRRQEKK